MANIYIHITRLTVRTDASYNIFRYLSLAITAVVWVFTDAVTVRPCTS